MLAGREIICAKRVEVGQKALYGGLFSHFPFCYPGGDHYIPIDFNNMGFRVRMVLDKSAMQERLSALDER
jgi:hypothetical protein